MEVYPDTATDTSHSKSTGASASGKVAAVGAKAHGHQQQSLNASASQNGISISNPPTQESDAKSDTSFDPLFDDEPEPDGDGDNHSGPDGVGQANNSHKESAAPDVPVGLGVPDAGGSDPTSQAQAVRSFQNAVAPPKNAPPLFSTENSTTFSSDVLMVSAIDGQIMLWDKRANTPGKGVGRLWLSEKTPPWCVSVRTRNCDVRSIGRIEHVDRHAGRRTDHRFTLAVELGRWTFGTFVCWDGVDRRARPDCSRVCGIRRVRG